MTDALVVDQQNQEEEVKPLTKQEILSWKAEEMLSAMKAGRSEEIKRVMNEPEVIPPTEEEVAAAEAQAAADAEAVRLQAEEQVQVEAQAAEAARIEAEKVEAARIEAEKPKKIVVEYQATDENGQAIGRPTHLEATTWEEMSKKQTEAHINALRLAERIKNRKVTFKKEETPIPSLTAEEIAQAVSDLQSEDPEKAAAAVRKLSDTEVLKQKIKEADDAAEGAREAAVSFEFMKAHLRDYNPCDANGQLFYDYMKKGNNPSGQTLEWTLDNLETAFEALQSQLAPVVNAPVATNPPVEPAPVVVEQTTTPVIVPVAAPVTASAPVPVGNTPAQVRKALSGGIQPGTLTAGRQVTAKPAGLTKDQIRKWTPEQMKLEMRVPGRAAEIERVWNAK